MVQVLGDIVRLQIQTDSLKVGEGRRLRYEPACIRTVESLRLQEGGVCGDGTIDVHNARHPVSKYRGENGVSVGFTAHYDIMRERFGPHLIDGIAGENILVKVDRRIDPDDLTGPLLIETRAGTLRLEEIQPAEPCVEFTRYALQWPPDAPSDRTVSEGVNFLRFGVRGYYATYRGEPVVIRVGDSVLLGHD